MTDKLKVEVAADVSALESRIQAQIDGGDWIDAKLANDWANFSDTYNTAQYRKDASNLVHLRGLLKGGATNAAFILDPGYHPLRREIHSATVSGMPRKGSGRVDITTEGVVMIHTTGDAWVSLDGISFYAK